MRATFDSIPSMPGDLGVATAFPTIFGVVMVLIGLGIAWSIYKAARNRQVLRDAGHDPVTVQAELAARILNSDVLAPSGGRSIEARLAELERLHAAGTISDDERAAARARILSE